jgi:glutamine synthetase adenylyltransferase
MGQCACQHADGARRWTVSDESALPSPPPDLLRYAMLIGITQELIARLSSLPGEDVLHRLTTVPEGDQLVKASAHGAEILEHAGQYLLDQCVQQPDPEQTAADRCGPLLHTILDAITQLTAVGTHDELAEVVLQSLHDAMADPPVLPATPPRRHAHQRRSR